MSPCRVVNNQTTTSRSRRRGAMVVMVAVGLIIFLFMAAFSIDVAYMQLTRAELRAATDAAARAAANSLAMQQSTDAARQAALNIASQNMVAGAPMQLDPSDVVFGNSQLNSSGTQIFTAGGTPTNAAQIQGRKTDGSPAGSVPLFLGGIFGVDRFQPVQSATAAKLDRDIMLVLDHSGSMTSNNRWDSLRDAVTVFLSELNTTPQIEHVGIVGYSTSATKVQALTDDLNLVQTKFDDLSPGGMTAIGEGLLMGSDAFLSDAMSRSFAEKTIVVMTDGNHNTGQSPSETVLTAAARGDTVHTITFGDGANQTLMSDVANAGGGMYLHAPDAAALIDAFRQIARTLPVVLTE